MMPPQHLLMEALVLCLCGNLKREANGPSERETRLLREKHFSFQMLFQIPYCLFISLRSAVVSERRCFKPLRFQTQNNLRQPKCHPG